uniref:Uncharacterized protein n=1 Tax=Triticum aestivum TaxID=4565 RepID=A0A077RW02_WHEAT|nr:unnamed protein product [Triticum aestivum]
MHNSKRIRLYEVKDGCHAEAFLNSVSLGNEEAMPIGERVAVLERKQNSRVLTRKSRWDSREISFNPRSSRRCTEEDEHIEEEQKDYKRRSVQSLGWKQNKVEFYLFSGRGGRAGGARVRSPSTLGAQEGELKKTGTAKKSRKTTRGEACSPWGLKQNKVEFYLFGGREGRGGGARRQRRWGSREISFDPRSSRRRTEEDEYNKEEQKDYKRRSMQSLGLKQNKAEFYLFSGHGGRGGGAGRYRGGGGDRGRRGGGGRGRGGRGRGGGGGDFGGGFGAEVNMVAEVVAGWGQRQRQGPWYE